ncbi:hypothetical protein TNCV_2603821 [Trichonephila clavipes]|nr:hypothetical protein TNCV_2603821 [Trichonephila clavipes]
MVMVVTRVRVTHLMADYDESGPVTADLAINLTSRSAVALASANRVLAHRSLTTNSRRVSRLLARTLDLNFPETAEISSSPRPLSPSTSTNKKARSQKQANQRQAPNTLSMGRRNASRSSAQ